MSKYLTKMTLIAIVQQLSEEDIKYIETYIKNLEQRIDKATKVLEECKMLYPHEFSWEEQADNLLEILKGSDNNE